MTAETSGETSKIVRLEVLEKRTRRGPTAGNKIFRLLVPELLALTLLGNRSAEIVLRHLGEYATFGDVIPGKGADQWVHYWACKQKGSSEETAEASARKALFGTVTNPLPGVDPPFEHFSVRAHLVAYRTPQDRSGVGLPRLVLAAYNLHYPLIFFHVEKVRRTTLPRNETLQQEVLTKYLDETRVDPDTVSQPAWAKFVKRVCAVANEAARARSRSAPKTVILHVPRDATWAEALRRADVEDRTCGTRVFADMPGEYRGKDRVQVTVHMRASRAIQSKVFDLAAPPTSDH